MKLNRFALNQLSYILQYSRKTYAVSYVCTFHQEPSDPPVRMLLVRTDKPTCVHRTSRGPVT